MDYKKLILILLIPSLILAAGQSTQTIKQDLQIQGQLDMNTHAIVNVVNPSSSQDAATKTYVDSITLLGDITGARTATTVSKIQTKTVSGTTGTTNVVFSNSPTLVTPALGTPSALVGTNITGTASGLTAGNVTTDANLTGPITSVGNATSVASQTGTGSTFVMNTSPTLVTPNLGTPSTLVGTNISGTAASLTAGHVTTNANLTGPITSVGNATSIAAQTGTGSTFVVDTSPTIVTPTITTSAVDPLLIGGTAVGASLSLQSTSGVGTTDFIKFLVGNNGATEAARITHAGNVGIGSATPGAKLDVVGGGAFTTGVNLATSSGNVGIGTTAPGDLLDLKVGGNQGITLTYPVFSGPSVHLWQSNNYDGTLDLYSGPNRNIHLAAYGSSAILQPTWFGYNGTTSAGARIEVIGNNGVVGNIQDSDLMSGVLVRDNETTASTGGVIAFGYSLGAGTYFAGIKGLGTSTSTNTTGDLGFYTRNATNSGSLSERMRITQLGNIGIGTTAPAAQLDVKSSSNTKVGEIVRGGVVNSGISGPDIVEWLDSAGTKSAWVDYSGGFNSVSAFNTTALTASLWIKTPTIYSDIYSPGIGPVIDMDALTLNDPVNGGGVSVDWTNNTLTATSTDANLSIDWANRYLANTSGVNLLDWSTGNVGIGTTAPGSKLEVRGGHLTFSQATAPVATVNANAGTGASCSVSNAKDNSGKITLTTTAVAAVGGTQCSVAFNVAFASTPNCTIGNTSANSTLLGVTDGIYWTPSTTALAVVFANADLVGRTFTWNYSCF